MKKFLLNRIRDGEFEPSKSIQSSIDSLNDSYKRARKNIRKMHGNDELTLEESLTREFRYYASSLHKLKLQQFQDEEKKMYTLRKELIDIFGVDVWDEVIQNTEFNSLEELYENTKLYVRKHHA